MISKAGDCYFQNITKLTMLLMILKNVLFTIFMLGIKITFVS